MNIQQLRQSLKQKWLSYYEQNCPWLVKMRIWHTYDGLRRPSSGFILATLSVLEPHFDEILSFMLELNNNPDKIVTALGLNFNPDEELRLIKSEHSTATNPVESESPQEQHFQDKAVPLVVTTSKIAPQSPAKTLQSNLLPNHQAIPVFTAPTEVDRTVKSRTLVTVATKIAPDTAVKPSHSAKSGLLREHQPVRSSFATSRQTSPLKLLPSGALLIITTEVRNQAKTMPSLASATEVASNSKLVPSGFTALEQIPSEASPAVNTEIKNNGKDVNMQPEDVKKKVNLLPSNARSLASWVDGFCQGTQWDAEEDVFI